MKKIIFILLCACAIFLGACEQQKQQEQWGYPQPQPLHNFNLGFDTNHFLFYYLLFNHFNTGPSIYYPSIYRNSPQMYSRYAHYPSHFYVHQPYRPSVVYSAPRRNFYAPKASFPSSTRFAAPPPTSRPSRGYSAPSRSASGPSRSSSGGFRSGRR